MKIVVGGIIKKDNKVLLVQEAKSICYGKWNLPAGTLQLNESLIEGATREIKEETGCDVEITGVLNIGHRFEKEQLLVSVIFSTNLLNENIEFNSNEILDVKWIDIDKIMNKMDDSIRDINLLKQPLNNLLNNNIGPLEIVNKL